MGTPPPPEPLHKMALRLQQRSRSRSIRIDSQLQLRADELLPSLIRIRQRMSITGLDTRANECLVVERAIRSGRKPQLRQWLRRDIQAIHSPERPADATRRMPATTATPTSARRDAPPPEEIVATNWAESCPRAPESALLPSMPSALAAELKAIGIEFDDDGLRWVRWACLHRSYVYESVPDSPVSAETLALLAALGKGWMRMALLDRVRMQRGEFESNNEVSVILASDKQVRHALARWTTAIGAPFFGHGEAQLLTAGSRSTAPEVVGLQILGALSMVAASQVPADGLLERLDFELEAPEPEWVNLLASHLKAEPTYTRTEVGPDHDKQFTVTVEARGHSASGTASSAKAARRLAAREYVQRFLPAAVPSSAVGRRQTSQAVALPTTKREHHRARQWAQQAFEVAGGGLMSQALTHRSWVHENREVIARAHQRDYGVLATEGSEALSNVVRHHYVLHILNQNVRVPASAVTSPALPGEVITRLFDQMPVAGGILSSRGTAISADIKEDVTQAIVGAAWRANGDLLMERQPATLARWVESFNPPRDPSTLLQEYCARHLKSTYSAEFERRGPDHQAEFRATLTFDVDGRPTWRGSWRSGGTPAKQSAAGAVLDFLLGAPTVDTVNSDDVKRSLLRGLLLAELRASDTDNLSYGKEIASGRLGVDSLAAGDYSAFAVWARLRSPLLPASGSAVAGHLSDYYTTVLTAQRRSTLRQWAVGHMPTRGVERPDNSERVTTWWKGENAARLALLDDLLSSVNSAGFTDGSLEFVQRQAMSVSDATGLELESIRDSHAEGDTLTLRLSGAELADALDPITDVVAAVLGDVMWARDVQSLSVTVPALPSGSDVLAQAGFRAVEQSRQDPWLGVVQRGLREYLALADRVLAGIDDLTADTVDDLVAGERALVSVLRQGS